MESLQTAVDLSKQEIIHLEENMRLTHEVAWLFPHQGEWTEEDYFRLPDTNHFVELSEGRLVIPEMPTYSHQNAVAELFIAIRMFVVDLEECAIEVYVLKQGRYKLLGKWSMGQIARSEVLTGFEVAVETIIKTTS